MRDRALTALFTACSVALCPGWARGTELLFATTCSDELQCLQRVMVLSGKRVVLGESFLIADPFSDPPVYSYIADAQLADLNGDRFSDLITDRMIFMNDGSGAFVPVAVFADFGIGGSVIALDADSDGQRDVVASAEDGGTLITLNDGEGGFRGPDLPGGHSSSGGRVLAAGDVTEDGLPDIFVGWGLFASFDKGVFDPPTPIVQGDADWSFFIYDGWILSRDGILPNEIFIHAQRIEKSNPSRIEEALYLVPTSFDEPVRLFLTRDHSKLILLDADADGVFDVIECRGQNTRNATTTVHWGSRGFVFTQGPVFPRAGLVLVHDLDEDGFSDIVIGSSIWWGTSKRGFSAEPHELGFNAQPADIGIILPRFVRGDVDGAGELDISDPVATLLFLFGGGDPLPCPDAADADDNGLLDISDPIRTLNYLFLGGEALPEPHGGTGFDPTADDLGCMHPHGPIAAQPVMLSRPGF